MTEAENKNENQVPLLENFHFHSAPEENDVSFQFHQTKRDGPSIDINIPRVNASSATIKIDDRHQIEELDGNVEEFDIEKNLSTLTCCFIFFFIIMTINLVFTLISFFKEIAKWINNIYF